MNIALVLESSARRQPDATAVVFRDRRIDYATLNRGANRIAAGLSARGYGKTDKIALFCSNRPEFITSYFGILKTGATVVPLNNAMKRPEITGLLRRADVRALVAETIAAAGDHILPAAGDAPLCTQIWTIPAPDDPAAPESSTTDVPALSQLTAAQPDEFDTVPTASDDTASINFTSGTTGQPKGVETTHGGLLYQVLMNQGLADREMSPSRLIVLPLFHIMSQVLALNLGLFSGEKLVLMDRFDPATALELMRVEQISHVAGVPAVFQALVAQETAGPSTIGEIKRHLRLAPCGGAPLPHALAKRFQELFGTPIREGYGLTETGSVVTWHLPGDDIRPGSVGKPVPGAAVRIVDGSGTVLGSDEVGCIQVRSSGIMKGYYKDAAGTAAILRDGWLATGDIGSLDDDGYLQLLGRSDDMIIRGATKVFPAEIEAVLEQHPAVAQAVVVGIPDAALGQEVKAVIVPRENANPSTDEIERWAKERIADDKYPRVIEFIETIPLTETGKVLRTALTE